MAPSLCSYTAFSRGRGGVIRRSALTYVLADLCLLHNNYFDSVLHVTCVADSLGGLLSQCHVRRKKRYGRRRRLSDEAVQEVLEDIRRDAGGVALHAITRAVGAEGRQYLEREGWRALAPAESEEVSGDAAARAEAESYPLSLVTLNVDGLGDYADSPAARMDAILTRVLLVEPDVLVLQEVTAAMLTQLRRRLPEWKVIFYSILFYYSINKFPRGFCCVLEL